MYLYSTLTSSRDYFMYYTKCIAHNKSLTFCKYLAVVDLYSALLAVVKSLFYIVKVCLHVCVDIICSSMEASGRQGLYLLILHNAQQRALYIKLYFYLMMMIFFMHFFPFLSLDWPNFLITVHSVEHREVELTACLVSLGSRMSHIAI